MNRIHEPKQWAEWIQKRIQTWAQTWTRTWTPQWQRVPSEPSEARRARCPHYTDMGTNMNTNTNTNSDHCPNTFRKWSSLGPKRPSVRVLCWDNSRDSCAVGFAAAMCVICFHLCKVKTTTTNYQTYKTTTNNYKKATNNYKTISTKLQSIVTHFKNPQTATKTTNTTKKASNNYNKLKQTTTKNYKKLQ